MREDDKLQRAKVHKIVGTTKKSSDKEECCMEKSVERLGML